MCKRECADCKEEKDHCKRLPNKETKTKEWVCKSCACQRRKNHRQITKEEFIPGYKENVERRNRPKIKEAKPAIEPVIKEKKKALKLSFYLSNEEQTVLYHKFTREGMSSKEANNEIKNLKGFLHDNLVDIKRRYREGLITEEEANKEWREQHNLTMAGL